LKVYIVYGHPNHKGLCYAALEKARQGFEDAGHEVRVTDLYQEKDFDPVLRYDDPRELGGLQRCNEYSEYRDNFSWCNHMVFIYPIWWASMPAIMRGFVDVVFCSGFAYNFKGIFPKGHWSDKTAWIITVHDTPWVISQFVQRDYGRIFKNQVLRSTCGVKKVRHTEMAFTKRSTLAKRQKFLAKVYKIANNLK